MPCKALDGGNKQGGGGSGLQVRYEQTVKGRRVSPAAVV